MNRGDWLRGYSYHLDQAEALSGVQFRFLSNEGVGLHSVLSTLTAQENHLGK